VLLAVACALLAIGDVRPGYAQSFDKHYKRGLALYQQKDYAGAIDEMSAAYEQRQLPRLLLNIGQAYRKMGKAREALLYYEKYLKADPDAPPQLKSEIATYIEQSRALIEAPSVRETIERVNEPAPFGWDRETGKMTPEYAAQLKEEERRKPLYKKPWFWGVVGGAAAAVIIVGVTVGVVESRQLPSGIDIIKF
jgi:tetratricopeptide (TPR) repeat protein